MTYRELYRSTPRIGTWAIQEKPAGLSEAERQVLLDEIAQIAAELNELQRRAAQIAGRVARREKAPGEAAAGRVDRSA